MPGRVGATDAVVGHCESEPAVAPIGVDGDAVGAGVFDGVGDRFAGDEKRWSEMS